MKKVFSVELETIHTNVIEPFWMYKGFGYDKKKALDVAEILSGFYPSIEYPTKVFVYQEEETEQGNLINKTSIFEKMLRDENGFMLVKFFNKKEEALKYWEENYPFFIYSIENDFTKNYLLKIKEYEH